MRILLKTATHFAPNQQPEMSKANWVFRVLIGSLCWMIPATGHWSQLTYL